MTANSAGRAGELIDRSALAVPPSWVWGCLAGVGRRQVRWEMAGRFSRFGCGVSAVRRWISWSACSHRTHGYRLSVEVTHDRLDQIAPRTRTAPSRLG
jgi:hypothetical protein